MALTDLVNNVRRGILAGAIAFSSLTACATTRNKDITVDIGDFKGITYTYDPDECKYFESGHVDEEKRDVPGGEIKYVSIHKLYMMSCNVGDGRPYALFVSTDKKDPFGQALYIKFGDDLILFRNGQDGGGYTTKQVDKIPDFESLETLKSKYEGICAEPNLVVTN